MPASTVDDDLDALDISSVCRRSKTGRSFVYEEIRNGRLIARKLGRLTRVLRADYEAWLAAAPPIITIPPSTRTGIEPNPAPELHLSSVPINVLGNDGTAKRVGVLDRPRVGRNGVPERDAPRGIRRRHVRPGAHQ
jgi:excisionase family DNA binding protein